MGRRVLDVVVTVIAVAGSLLSSLYAAAAHGYSVVDGRSHLTWWSGITLLVATGAAVMLCWRRRWPLLVTGIAVVPPLLFVADSLAALIALAALATKRRDYVLWVVTAVVYVATVLAVWRDAHRPPAATVAGLIFGAETTVGQVIGILLLAAAMTAVPVTVGTVRRVRQELARQADRERELRAEMTRREERTRIAREMHDMLGHRLSLLSLQAGALEVSQDAGSSPVTEVARTVRATARQSLADLRQVIGVLRDGRGVSDPQVDAVPPDLPQLSLADIPGLVATTRRSGLAANLTILLDDVASAPALLGTTAYRIVQEALTNVLRHGGDAVADVTVRGGPGVGLTIEVVNPLPHHGATEPSPGSGTGLTGVNERVALLGGNVSAGPTEEGAFALHAWLPWQRP